MSFAAIAVAVGLVIVNGFFVAVEFAYTASRRPVLEGMAAEGNRFARWALVAMNELPVTFAGAQLGVAGASLALGFIIESSMERGFERVYESLGLPQGAVASAALITSLLIVSFVHNVLGEMAPKNATIAAPEKAALLLAAPFRVYAFAFRPFIIALSWVASAVLRLFGVTARRAVEVTHSAEDIATLVRTVGAGGMIDPGSSRLLTSALQFQDTLVSDVMVPRPDLVALPADEKASVFERTVVATGHSRIPVYGEDLDDVEGFVHVKDLMSIDPSDLDSPIPPDLIREVPVVPETMPVSPLMEMMRFKAVHLAVAIDEHGSVSGLVTLEDIAEELVGEIRDEHDIREVMEVRPAGRDRYLIAGQTRVDRLASLGVDIEEGDYDTVGGFLMTRLGRVPRRGDALTEPGFEMTVRRMDGRRVREVEVAVREGEIPGG